MLLIAVAATQMLVAANSDLTPWRGGGFGMFSTLDNHDLRQVRVELTTPGGERASVDVAALVQADPPWRDRFVVARAMPTERNLTALGHALAADPQVMAAAPIGDVDVEEAQGDPQPMTTEYPSLLRIEVWRVRFERATNTLVPELIIAHQIRP